MNRTAHIFEELKTLEWKLYACPDSHVPLVNTGDVLISPETGRQFVICDGIPIFLRYDPSEDIDTVERLEQLNKLTPKIGWYDALNNVYDNKKDVIQYVTDHRRASYIELLPLTPNSRVLEIGPSLGQHTTILSSKAKSIHALEVIPSQAAFVAQRCLQEGAFNVFVACGGDDCKLPYLNNSFDIVILNLVFEWCASKEINEKSEKIQKRMLIEIRRILKSKGTLYLATKNRYDLRLLLGKRDFHAHNMRFGNALPRWLMRLILSLRMKDRETGLLYSYPALNRLLRSSGYEIIQSFWATPDMRFPDYYIPTDSKSVRTARHNCNFDQGRYRSTSLMMQLIPANLVKYFTPGLVFLARKS